MDEVIRNRSQDIADRSIHLNTFHCDADSIIFDLNELKINLDQYSQPETDIDHIHHQQNELKVLNITHLMIVYIYIYYLLGSIILLIIFIVF